MVEGVEPHHGGSADRPPAFRGVGLVLSGVGAVDCLDLGALLGEVVARGAAHLRRGRSREQGRGCRYSRRHCEYETE